MTDFKFINLRKCLDKLGYHQPLGIESVPLVEKLFSDLVHTTESFKNYKQMKHQQKKEISSIDHSESYRNDNARLVYENNELHMQLVKLNEKNSKSITELKSKIRNIEHQNEDLVFLNSQYVQNLKTLEKESNRKSEHIERLQDKSLHAVIETPGGGSKKKSMSFRRQRMDLDCSLPPAAPQELSANAANIVDPYIADLLQVADDRYEKLSRSFKELEEHNRDMQQKNTLLKKQVKDRDHETNRLTEALEGGRPVEAVLKENHKSSGDKVVAHLNIQVDYLQQANGELEERLARDEDAKLENEDKLTSLTERNQELCMELAKLDKLYKENSKNAMAGKSALNATMLAGQMEAENNNLRNELQQKLDVIASLQAKISQHRKDRELLIKANEKLQMSTREAISHKENVHDMVDWIKMEKRKLKEKKVKISISERELALEAERLATSEQLLEKKIELNNNEGFLTNHNAKTNFTRKSTKSSNTQTQNTSQKSPELHTPINNHQMQIIEDNRKPTSKDARIREEQPRISTEVIREKENEISRLAVLLDESERALNDLKDRFQEKCAEVQQTKLQLNEWKDKYEICEECHSEAKKEISRLNGVVSRLDKERDALQQQADSKAEDIDKLNSVVRDVGVEDSQLKVTVKELQEKIRYREEKITSKERQITEFSQQVQSLQEELAGVARSRNSLIVENRKTQEDLALMTSENQDVHNDLRQALDESEVLKKEIEEYVMQLSRIQKLLIKKEEERDDFLLQYETLSNRADILECSVQQSEDEAESIKQSLIRSQQELLMREEQCASLAVEVKQHQDNEESYERQIHHLKETLHDLDGQLSSSNEEKANIFEDLSAVRELCVKLDKTREELSNKLANQSQQIAQLSVQSSKEKAEKESLLKEVEETKSKLVSLEKVVSCEREKHCYDTQTVEQLNMQVDRLINELAQYKANNESPQTIGTPNSDQMKKS